MKIVTADSKGRVTGMEPGVEYKSTRTPDGILLVKTDKPTASDLRKLAREVLGGFGEKDEEWKTHVDFAIRHGVYRTLDEIWYVANGWVYAKKSMLN